jgi:hypothetical protein
LGLIASSWRDGAHSAPSPSANLAGVRGVSKARRRPTARARRPGWAGTPRPGIPHQGIGWSKDRARPSFGTTWVSPRCVSLRDSLPSCSSSSSACSPSSSPGCWTGSSASCSCRWNSSARSSGGYSVDDPTADIHRHEFATPRSSPGMSSEAIVDLFAGGGALATGLRGSQRASRSRRRPRTSDCESWSP